MTNCEFDSLLSIENILTISFLDAKIKDNFQLILLRDMTPDEEIEKLEKQNDDMRFWKEELEKEVILNLGRKFK